jgi:hypothetical protein
MSCYQYFLQYLDSEQSYKCLIGIRFQSKIPISLNYSPCNHRYYLTKWRHQSIITQPCSGAFELKIEPPFEIRIVSVTRQADQTYLVIVDFPRDISIHSITESRKCINKDWINIDPFVPDIKHLSAILDLNDLGIRFQDKICIDGNILTMLS